jgi:uncharacterized protein (UPF0335 family)
MTNDEEKSLTYIVGRVAELNKQIQEANWEIKEVADSAWDKAGVKSKVVRQLAREQAWDAVKREKQRQHEEAVDVCRAKLGMLADTPLGESAMTEAAKPQRRNGKSGYKGKNGKRTGIKAETAPGL